MPRKIPTGIALRFGAVIGLFLAFAGDAVRVYFSGDDLMNLYQYVQRGWGESLGLAAFWSSRFYRPMGGVAYLALYSLFGFHPAGFKIALLLLHCANLALAWRVAALLLEDSRLAFLATLLIAYRATSNDLYYNFGMIYDVLCFTFLLAALVLWLQIRRANRFPNFREAVLLALLHIAALGAKEMAVALPVLLLLREALWGRLISRPAASRSGLRVEWRAVPTIGLLAAITAIFIAGKLTGAGSLVHNPQYQPVFTLHNFLAAMARYLNALFYTETFHPSGERLFRSGITAWFLCGGLAVAAWLRLRAMVFGWLWFIVCLLPVAFVQGRGGFVLCIPALGLGVAVVDLARRAWAAGSKRLAPSLRRLFDPAGGPVFVFALVCLIPIHWHFKRVYDPKTKFGPAVFESFAADLTSAGRFARGSSVLYLWDPLPDDDYDALFLTSLLRHDPQIKVGRAKRNQALLSPAVVATYAEVFDFREGHLRRAGASAIPGALERLRAAHGYVDPGGGFYLDVESWPRWWVQRDFTLAAGCPALLPRCRLTVSVLTLAGLLGEGERRTVSVAINGAPPRDYAIVAQPGSSQIDVPLAPGVQPTRLQFHLDRAIDPARFPAGTPERALMIGGLQVR